MSTQQLTFFEKTKEDIMQAEIDNLHDDISKLRKGMFARHGELFKSFADLQDQINNLKDEIKNV